MKSFKNKEKSETVLIIFGITGNLAQIKLIPALYDLAEHNLLPENFSVIGIGRKPYTNATFSDYVAESLRSQKMKYNKDISAYLIDRITYLRGDIDEDRIFEEITEKTHKKHKMFYLATYPSLYAQIFEKLQKHGLHKQNTHGSRVIIEKPLGTNLESARELDKLLLTHFTEDQIYRLDHYLGKDTLQNMIHFRFGNSMIENLMDSSSIDHIQITSSENFGVGSRGGYYDTVGALKDVGQNHLLQMLALATMSAPRSFSNRDITDSRIEVLKNVSPDTRSLVLGQYEGYTKEESVFEHSDTDTYFAFKLILGHGKLSGVPVYIRGGKNLPQTVSEVAVVFKKTPNKLLDDIKGEEPNILFYRIQPNEGIVLKIFVKSPGHTHIVEPTYMQFCYKNVLTDHDTSLISPYERLLFDAMQGDQTFFNDAPEIESQWKIIDSLLAKKQTTHLYKVGSWGPKEAEEMIRKDGRCWIEPSPTFCSI